VTAPLLAERLWPDAAEALAARALAAAGANPEMARLTAAALVGAEIEGQAGHGLSRVPMYAGFLREGRAKGDATPRLAAERGGMAVVDAANGLAYPALALAEAEVGARARDHAIAFVAVTNSHHAGALSLPVRRLAEQGLVALAFTNSPAAMPVPGGRRPLLGTNPVAAAFPRRAAPPLLVDLALSEVARGKIMVAAHEGRPIPEGWALDAEGRPTTDAKAALGGAMLAIGGPKGAALALVVELLCCALGGAAFGFEADSFFAPSPNPPRLGHALMALDPGALAGPDAFLDRIEALVTAMLGDEGVRLPGARREALRAAALRDGIAVPPALLAELHSLAGI
jgi:(2R)-3-sulfolactate dehydrogenase (NADP+)